MVTPHLTQYFSRHASGIAVILPLYVGAFMSCKALACNVSGGYPEQALSGAGQACSWTCTCSACVQEDDGSAAAPATPVLLCSASYNMHLCFPTRSPNALQHGMSQGSML